MTIPDTNIYPLRKDLGNDVDITRYVDELIFTLTNRDAQIVNGINGVIFSDLDDNTDQNYTPVLRDTANAGTTFTYTHQTGWALRRGLMTDVWFDVLWTANTGAITGNMYVELPYEVASSNNMPFVGVCQPSGFAFTGGTECVVNVIPDTYRAEIWNTGSAFATANQGSVAAGRLICHVRYLGKEDDQS